MKNHFVSNPQFDIEEFQEHFLGKFIESKQTGNKTNSNSPKSQSNSNQSIKKTTINKIQDQQGELPNKQTQKTQKVGLQEKYQVQAVQQNNYLLKKRDEDIQKNFMQQQMEESNKQKLLSTEKFNKKPQQVQEKSEMKQQSDLCAFCQNEFMNQNQALRFICLHSFHDICFQSIAPDSSFCPYCPNNMTGMSIQPIQIIQKKQQKSQKIQVNKNSQNRQQQKRQIFQQNILIQKNESIAEFKQSNTTNVKRQVQKGKKQSLYKEQEVSKQKMQIMQESEVMSEQSRICHFCEFQLGNSSIIFECQHMFHHDCFQAIASNSSYCAYCPKIPRQKKHLKKEQIREKMKQTNQDLIYCPSCNQQVQICNLFNHQLSCKGNQICYYCKIQYPSDLITEHYKQCQMRQYYQNLSNLKQQALDKRKKEKQEQLKMIKQKKQEMITIMKTKQQNNKRAKELFKQVIGIQLASNCQECCMICIANISKGQEISILKCQHVFHSNCLMSWGVRNFSCPACRRCLQKKQENDNQFDWF